MATETKEEPDTFRIEVIDKVAALATAAFGLVAALAWNSAIQAVFAQYFGENSALFGMIVYALVVTALAVGATIWIGRVAGRARARAKKVDRGDEPRTPPRSPGRPMA